jgi:hypothetical protein
MPHQPTVTDIRTNNIVTGLNLVTTLVDELHDALGTSCLQAVSQTALSMVTAIQVRDFVGSVQLI